ncbi:hypothetical protein DMN91_008942 [Ooceraea biroi]|uniref:15-hydroxyprostaglandin dehydrogenase [NAD+] n=1 Tax=Ooceraea biroi TaxID=2015173 RepID=A0A3L8DDS4_OOCBI|nr:hypothetical protein DMN91_008942 [Ooceraea biroi]
MEIQEKIVLITGGANGIGYCTAQELLRSGAKVIVIVDLPDSNGENAAAELGKEFGANRAIFLVGNVTNDKELAACFDKAVELLGPLDIIINNAGIINDAEWEPMVDINYKGVVRGTILGLNHMGKHKGGKGGTIINMSSIVGLQGNPLAPIYAGTQFAILGFTSSLQTFYEKTGVRLLVICPGLTSTNMASKFMSSKTYAMDILDDEIAAKAMMTMESQSPEHVATAIAELLEKGKNGTIFIKDIELPYYIMENVQNKTAIVTGGGSGIGYCITQELLRNGAKVALIHGSLYGVNYMGKHKGGKGGTIVNIASSIAILRYAEVLPVYTASKYAVVGFSQAFKNKDIELPYYIMENVQNKTAIVTGGGSGIGYCIIEELLRNGAKVALIRGSLYGLNYMSKHKGGKGGTIVNIASVAGLHYHFSFIPVYAATKHAVVGFSQALKNKDIELPYYIMENVQNKTAIVTGGGSGIGYCIIEELLRNGAKVALIRGSLYGLNYMSKHKGGKGGTIVNIASVAGLRQFSFIPVYAATKHAVVGFSQALKVIHLS